MFLPSKRPTGVGLFRLKSRKGLRVRRTLSSPTPSCPTARRPDNARDRGGGEAISATAMTMATAEMETASSRGAIMARLDMLAARSLGRLPSWQEDLSLIAIRGRSCRLCVRALCKMALIVGASL